MNSIKFLAALFLFSAVERSYSQSYQSQRNEVLLGNVLTSGIISGVGSTFNRSSTEKILPVFARNFAKGCLGGLIKYGAKYQSFYLRQPSNVFFAPINRGFFFLGHSMVLNASMNQKLLENYYCNFYGVNFWYNSTKKKGDRLSARASLSTLYSLIYLSALGDRINVFKTIEYGQFYLDLADDATIEGQPMGGRAIFNAFSIRKFPGGQSLQSVVPHEIIHTYQSYDYFGFSSIYQKRLNAVLQKHKVYNIISKYIDFDYEPAFFSGLYALQPQPLYFGNYFEYEAEHFSRRIFIKR